MTFDKEGQTPSGNTQTAPEEDWFKQWDPLDNGKAGPIRMKIFWLCAIPGFLMPFASSIFIPVIPVINAEYQPSDVVATLTISIYSLLSGIVPMFWGPLSDKYSRKWILTGSLFAYAILNYLNAWTDSMAGIIVMRTLIAIPVAALFVVSTGILTDIFREKERVFWLGVRNLPLFAAVLVAPPLGGVMVYLFDWQSTAVLQAIIGTVCGLVILFMLPETLNKAQAKYASSNPLAPIKIMLQPKILPNALVQGFGFAGMYVAVGAMPLTFPEIYSDINPNLLPIYIGLALVPYAFGCAVGAVAGGITTKLISKRVGACGTLLSSLIWNALCLPAFILWGFTIGINILLPMFFVIVIGVLRTATTPPLLTYCIEENPNQSSAVNAGLLAVQFVFGSICLTLFPSLAALVDSPGLGWGTLMCILSFFEALCFIPIGYFALKLYRECPPLSPEEEKLLTSETIPEASTPTTTSSISNMKRRLSQRESSLTGYMSDGAEFMVN